MGIEENNKESLRKQIEEVWNKGNLEIIPEVISPDYSMMSPTGVELKGHEGFRQFVTFWRNVFPDFHYIIDDMVAEGNKVALRATEMGTFKGKYGDIEPTGNNIEIPTAVFYEFKDGKEVAHSHVTDRLTFYQQSGIPIPENP